MLLEGIYLPLTTPFHPDGRLYLRKLESNVARYSLTPAAGMLVLGSSGEVDGLTDAEAREILAAAIGAAADDKVMIAGVGREAVAATLEAVEVAAKAGYDAVAIRSPAFAGETAMRLELTTYFQAVADRSALPVVLLSERDRPLAQDVVAELACHPGIIGLIDAALSGERMDSLQNVTAGVSREVQVTSVFAAVTGRMRRQLGDATGNFVPLGSLGGVAVLSAQTPIKIRSKRVGFQLLAGSTDAMLSPWSRGSSGAVPRLGACAPQACCEVWQAFRDGDPALAEEKQTRILRPARMMEGLRGVAAVKYGCDLNGYFGGRPRLPLLPLTGAERGAVEAQLAGLKN